MKSREPNDPRRPWPELRGGRLPVVLALVAVLGLSLATAAITRIGGRPAPTPAPAAAAAAPAQPAIPTYTASITNGASQNDLYEWLVAHAGTVVRVVLSISKPVAADLANRPKSLTLASNCSSTTPPANCARLLNLSGTRYLVYGEATTQVTVVKNVYKVDAYVAVEHVTQDRQGLYTLPLRIVEPNGPADGEDD